MKSLSSDRAAAAVMRLRQRAIELWWLLPEERRDRIARRRWGLLWKLDVVAALVAPWLLVALAVAAFLLQSTPRRIARPLAVTAAATVPAMWLRNMLADFGLADGRDGALAASALLAALAVVAVAALTRRGASGLRPILPWLDRGLQPVRYGIPGAQVLLGSAGRAWLSAPAQVGALVIGPPRSGKTSSVVVPNALAWTGPAVVTSTRRDVLDACWPVRARRGTVWCFDPVGIVATSMPPEVRRLDWSPVAGAASFDTALARARALLAGSVEGTEGRDHWRARGTQLLAALLHAAAQVTLPMSTVVEWVHAARLDAAARILDDGGDRRAAALLDGVARTPDRERGSIWSAVAGGLAAFDDSTVLASADRATACGFSAAGFLDGADTVFVIAPSDEGVPLAPVVVGLVEDIRAVALHRSNQSGALDRALLLALDEVATICPLPSLPQIAAEGGGRNIILIAVLQDLSQAAMRWGRDVADGLVTLAGAKLVLGGVADADTLQRLETLAGKRWVEHRSTSETWSDSFLRDRSYGTQRFLVEEPRIPAAAVRQLRAGTALCIVGAAPARVIRTVRPTDQPFARWRADSRPASPAT
jgi:type IV secretion system protein VirD4